MLREPAYPEPGPAYDPWRDAEADRKADALFYVRPQYDALIAQADYFMEKCADNGVLRPGYSAADLIALIREFAQDAVDLELGGV